MKHSSGSFLKQSSLFIFLILFFLTACTNKRKADVSKHPGKPNIIIIFTDDLDFDETNLYENKKFPCYSGAREQGINSVPGSASFDHPRMYMPHLDKLAKEGLVFNRFYVNSSLCTPVRYGLLTGKYPSKSPAYMKEYPPDTTANIRWNIPMLPFENNIATILNANGYTTGFIGKWHNYFNGKKIANAECLEDLENQECCKQIQSDYQYMKSFLQDSIGFTAADRIFNENQKFLNLEWLTEGALNFIDKHKEEPFFLYVSIPLPHAQYYRYKDWNEMLCPNEILDKAPEGQINYAQAKFKNFTHGILDKKKVMATWIDGNLGAIVKKLEQNGLTENTLIIFTSDHQTRGKFTTYEGCRVPFVLKYPGVVEGGRTSDQLCLITDIVPTIMDMLEIKIPEDIDGQSFMPVFKKETENACKRSSILLESGYSRAIISENWKYMANRPPQAVIETMEEEKESCQKRQIGWDGNINPHPQWDDGGVRYGADRDFPHYFDPDQLYNLTEDVFEQHNLAQDARYQQKLDDMKMQLKAELQKFPHKFGEFKE